ncbi:MAG: malate dehydrogenase [Cyclobacteriaceae bacterium]|nr:MAG: malate dehydrogenase [Cyclobacteriaceae bacterium]
MGCSLEQAELASKVLIDADLKGIDSHGIARLQGYVRLWEKDRINSSPDIRVVHQTPSTAVVDGDGGLGLVVAPYAMKIAIEKANAVGTGWVSVRNSNHFGIAGYHALMPVAHDMVGISMTNASPLVAPTFSAERLLGTNPIAVAIPAKHQPPFVADFATTTVANGKLEIMKRKQQPIPLGWAQDKNGAPSNDASCVELGGALVPLGGTRESGSHKGYCLGSIVDIFSAVFSGANFGPWVPPFVSFLEPSCDPVGKGIGHFLGAMRVDAFRPAEEFKLEMDRWINRFRSSKAAEGAPPVLIPGDPEREMEQQRLVSGIPLLDPVTESLNELAKRFELKSIDPIG